MRRIVILVVAAIVSFSCHFPLFCHADDDTQFENGSTLLAQNESNDVTDGTITTASDAEKQVFTLGEIEVIDTEESSGNPTSTRIYADEMRKFNADTLSEATNMLPGVTVEKLGARGETMIHIRGFDQKRVPIYQDGIPIYVPYDGYPDLGRFTTFDLSEVVVSKGFTSVLYGPNTMGGAVNMISKRPEEELEVGGGVRGFSQGYAGWANLGTNQDWWYLQVGASYLDSADYPLPDSYDETTEEDGDYRENSYRTDRKFSFKVGLTPNETDEYSFTYINQHGEKGSSPYAGSDGTTRTRYWQWPYWNKQSFYLNTNTAFGDDEYYIKTRLYYDKFENSLWAYDDSTYTTQNRNSSFRSFYDDHTIGGSVELGTYAIESHALKMAFHYKHDFHSEHNDGDPIQHFEEGIYSVGVEDTWDVTDNFYVIAGASFDYINSLVAENTDGNNEIVPFDRGCASGFNPQLGLFYRPIEGGLAHASVAWKTRMPSIKDKFSYRQGQALPNPALGPEKSVNYEVGYEQQWGETGIAEVTLFYYDISDFILQVDAPGGLWQNQNIGDVEQYGFELSVAGRIIGDLSGGANYTHLEYNNLSTDEELTNTPKNKLFAYLQYEFLEGLSLLVDGEYDSKRLSDTNGERVAGEYFLFGTKLEYALNDHLSLNLGVDNLLDEEYEIDEGQPEAGRVWYGGIDFKF